MKENYIIATRPHNALLVFKYECIPGKTVWDKEKYIGAYSHLVLRSLGEGGREKTSSVFICPADYAVTSKWSVSKTVSEGAGGVAEF